LSHISRLFLTSLSVASSITSSWFSHILHLFIVLFSLLFVPLAIAYSMSFTWFSHIFQFFLASDLMTSYTSLRCFSYLFSCFCYSPRYFSDVSYMFLTYL
jgi:hypothetical protein